MCTMHLNKFLSWKVDSRVADAVQATCFRWFLNIENQADGMLKQNSNLITSLIYFYEPNDHCFSFPESNEGRGRKNIYVDFGLEDILYITGLPIDGLQVTGFESAYPTRVVRNHLKVSESKAKELLNLKKRNQSYGIDLSALKKEFENVPNECSELELQPYVKAFILYLLGHVILSSPSRTISTMYLPLLDLKNVDNYAWGAAALASLKCSMGRAKKQLLSNERAYLTGFTFAFLVYAVERFPCVRGPLVSPSTFPLFLGWLGIITHEVKKTKNAISVEEYRQKLMNMKEEDIVWQPYQLANHNIEIPPELEHMLWIKYARVPCINFEQISLNRPDICYRQLALETRELRKLPRRQRMKLMQQSKHKGKDWRDRNNCYKHLNEEWKRRNEYIVKNNYVFLGELISDQGMKEEENNTKLLILDVNGILVHVTNLNIHVTNLCNRQADKVVNNRSVFLRPNAHNFLEFCLENFDVALWSSRKMENLESIVDMFPNLRNRLIFCWNQDNCMTIDTTGGRPLHFKELAKVWEKYPQYDEYNTLLVDDDPYKAIQNPVNTGIFPSRPSIWGVNLDNELGPEGSLRMYLERLANSKNVKDYVRMNPYGQHAITEAHVEWNFYQELIESKAKNWLDSGL